MEKAEKKVKKILSEEAKKREHGQQDPVHETILDRLAGVSEVELLAWKRPSLAATEFFIYLFIF